VIKVGAMENGREGGACESVSGRNCDPKRFSIRRKETRRRWANRRGKGGVEKREKTLCLTLTFSVGRCETKKRLRWNRRPRNPRGGRGCGTSFPLDDRMKKKKRPLSTIVQQVSSHGGLGYPAERNWVQRGTGLGIGGNTEREPGHGPWKP